MKNRKRLLALALVGVMSLGMLLSGCNNNATQSPSPSATTPVGTGEPAGAFDMTVCIASEPQTIDPALNSSVDGAVMTQHFFEGLMKWADGGKAVNEKGNMNYAELVYGQIESMEKADNGDGTVTYTFKIRPDAKWSDGKPVTAGDFVYSWQRLANPLTTADYCYMIDMVQGYDVVQAGTPTGEMMTVVDEETGEESEVEVYEYDPTQLGVSAPDDSTFVVNLTYDCPYFLEICAFPAAFPVRQDIVDAAPDTWTTDSVASYVSNGPWKMAEWVHDSYIKMVPNEYHYDVANLGPTSLTFQLMEDQNSMLAAYRSGDLQFIEDMPVDEISTLIANGELNIVDYVGTYYVCYQTQQAPFDDWQVRKAFTLAIDSKYIVEQITQTGQLPATGFVPAGVADADAAGDDFRTVGGDYWTAPEDDATYQANCEEARQLLADAGYGEGGKDFPVVTYLYNTSDAHKAVGEALQQMWQEELGVTVQLQNQEWNAFLETRKQGDYQIARNGWIADYNDPISFLDMWVTGGGNNDAQYSNPEYDAAIAEAKSTSDAAARMTALHKAEDIIMGQDWALGPIYFYTNKYMMDDSISGAFYTPLGYFIFGYCTKG